MRGECATVFIAAHAQTEHHEFVDGEVFAMAGAEDRQVTVAGNLYMALRQHLSGSPCRTCMSDMRVHVAAANSYFPPDVVVTCSPADQASPTVNCHHKGTDGLWVLHPFAKGETVTLASVALEIPAAKLFDEVPET
jgi:hypothetical protein